ncbi:MAG: sulfatase [Pirellulales bacterium]
MLLLWFVVIVSCAGAASGGPASPQRAKPPNVIFILADDLGWSDTTLYGHTRFHQTPQLERLAKRGMTFTRAYSASPLCSPTRAAILTGLSPARTGITTPNGHLPQVILDASPGKAAPVNSPVIMPVPPTRLRTEYRTLAEALREAGYATGHFGKWHLGSEPYSPLQQGFDVDRPHHPGPGPAGSYVAPWKFSQFAPDPGVPNQHIEDRLAREAVAFMEQHRDRPFFLNYWMFSVHAPFDAKRSLIEKHRARIDPQDEQRCPTYAAMIESLDDALGTLLDAVDRLQLAERTIIVFTSDNGGNMYSEVDGTVPTSNRPLRGGKATVFEGGVRVPAVIVMPGVTTPGSRSDAIIQSEDYYPTLLEALGQKPAPGQSFDGISIVPALRGEPLRREATFTYFPHEPRVPDWLPPAVAVHRENWKLIRIFHSGEQGAHRYLLFNLQEDESERHNLAEREPERVRQLDALIDTFLTDTKAVVPVPNPRFDRTQYRPELEGQAVRKTRGGSQVKPASPAATSRKEDDPALQGWKARACSATVRDGVLSLQSIGPAPFLGFAAGQLEAGTKLRFRIRCDGGAGQVVWLPSPSSDPATAPRPVNYSVKAGDWAEVGAVIPAPGDRAGIIRLFVPPQETPVELDWIEIVPPNRGRIRRIDF